jgi:hypothetical protein
LTVTKTFNLYFPCFQQNCPEIHRNHPISTLPFGRKELSRMPTTAQLDANRANAQKSTGPLTDAGKAASSRNRLTLGLYTQRDYVTFDERELYAEFCGAMHLELSPEGLLEAALATEVTAILYSTHSPRKSSAPSTAPGPPPSA